MKILAIEDNPADLEILRELLFDLQVSSFDLASAGSLATAGTILARGDTDFVLLDLGLPDSQGIETLRAVRANFPSLPIVVLTGFDDDETGMRALREGAQDYLVKGQIIGSSLVRSIRYANERNRFEQELIRKNIDLDAMNEELSSKSEALRKSLDELTRAQEELRQNYDELSNAEHALHEREEEYRLLADFTYDWVFWIGPDGRLKYVSPSAGRILGRPIEEGGSFEELQRQVCHPDDLEKCLAHLADEKAGSVPFEGEYRIVRPDGEVRWLHHVCQPIYDSEGRFLGTRGSNRDITERKQAEESLKVYAGKLKRSNEDLERFAYIASHDLREPLRMVTSFSQLLEKNYKGKLDKDADEFINFIVDGGNRMDALVNDLLEFSRVTSRASPFEQTDMNDVVHEVLDSLSVTIHENDAKVEVAKLPTIAVDRSQLAHVFQNLISNAVKFQKGEAPVIMIGSARQGNEWVFSVKDNGIGIDPRYHGKIFEIFQRLHNRDEFPGTGIGLAICKRIIERHNGRIWVESEEGKGSTFFFTIPAEKNE